MRSRVGALIAFVVVSAQVGVAFGQDPSHHAGHTQVPSHVQLPKLTIVALPQPFDMGIRRVVSDSFENVDIYSDWARHGIVKTPVLPPAGRAEGVARVEVVVKPRFLLGSVETTLEPLQVVSGVAAESRAFEAILPGIKLRMPWMVP